MNKILIIGKFDLGYIRDETLLYLIQKDETKLVDRRYIINQNINKSKSIIKRIKARVVRLLYYLYLIKLLFYLIIYKNNFDYIFIFKWNEEIFNVLNKINLNKTKIYYDLFVSRYLHAENNSLDKEKWYNVEENIIEKCDRCFTFNLLYRDYFKETYKIHDKKFSIIPHFTGIDWIEHKKRYSNNNGKIIVGYWGSVLKQHGVDKIFEVAERLIDNNNIIFRVIANEKIEREKYRHLSNVEFINPIQDIDDFIDEIDKMDVAFGHLNQLQDAHLLLPSKAMEAMARGKVVIHVYDRRLKDMMDSYGINPALLYYDGTVENLAMIIRDLEGNKKRMDVISKNAYKLIRQNFDVRLANINVFL